MPAELTTSLPALSTWLFYAGNVILIAAYLVICALMLRKEGLTGRGQMSPTLTTITCGFFLTCALLHLELAFDAYAGRALVRDGRGEVDPHFTALIIAKVALVVLFAFFTSRRAQSENGKGVLPFAPAEAAAERAEHHTEHEHVDEMRVDRVTIGEVVRGDEATRGGRDRKT